MLKIVTVARENGPFVLRLEGRVIGPWVEELRRSCERTLATGTGLSLDLSHVSFLDRDGVELLRTLRTRDVALVNCSPFVAEQLKAARPSTARTGESAEHGG
jgi:hypothetical protein